MRSLQLHDGEESWERLPSEAKKRLGKKASPFDGFYRMRDKRTLERYLGAVFVVLFRLNSRKRGCCVLDREWGSESISRWERKRTTMLLVPQPEEQHFRESLIYLADRRFNFSHSIGSIDERTLAFSIPEWSISLQLAAVGSREPNPPLKWGHLLRIALRTRAMIGKKSATLFY